MSVERREPGSNILHLRECALAIMFKAKADTSAMQRPEPRPSVWVRAYASLPLKRPQVLGSAATLMCNTKVDLDLWAMPLWPGKPLHESYLIAAAGRGADWPKLRGDVHAFSDSDSNSDFLVTRALFAEMASGLRAFSQGRSSLTAIPRQRRSMHSRSTSGMAG
jgi:hypothetical protein